MNLIFKNLFLKITISTLIITLIGLVWSAITAYQFESNCRKQGGIAINGGCMNIEPTTVLNTIKST
jgi:hypothetical protein